MPEDLHKKGPLAADHPILGRPCPACQQPLQAGDYVALIAFGPGTNPEEQEKARAGRPYNAVAGVVHWSCATGEP